MRKASKMECYNCGTQFEGSVTCPNCGMNIKIYKKIIMASNAYYNVGLEKANVRDLSGAIDSLKMSLRFNKRNTDARNLLGLVYFEMGETVAALTEWVLSKSYQPEDNRAGYYLDQIQHNKNTLDAINQTIKKYNQALMYCKQNSRDLAIIQLKKVLSMNPKLVTGHQLLALLYIQEKKFDLAKKCLRNAGKIDVNNKVTLRYLKEANAGLREQNPNRKQKNEELVSYQSGNETIIQPKYLKDTSAFATIVNMLIGIVIGVAITSFLVVPGVKSAAKQETQTAILESSNIISTKNQTIAGLEKQIESLSSQVSQMQTQGDDVASQMSSYENLLKAYLAYEENNIESAGNAIGMVYPEDLSEDAKQIYGIINAKVNEEYLKSVYAKGYKAYSERNYVAAIEDLKKVIELDEAYQNGNALYYLAQAYRKNNDLESAKPYYHRVIELFPDSERAATARNYVGAE